MFTIRWEDQASDEFSLLWTQTDDDGRSALADALTVLHQNLSTNPLGESESRDAGRRITFATPLAVTFRVEPDGRTISVLHVWRFQTRP